MTTSNLSTQPTVASDMQPARHSRKIRLRFSLRALLLAITLFAIAFPVWYVWPYTEREVLYAIDAMGRLDKTKPPRGETITSMKRVIGGDPVRHGVRTTQVVSGPNGEVLTESQEFVNGVAHGKYSKRLEGMFETEGQYENGEKIGEWVQSQGDFVSRQNWLAGKRHGEASLTYPLGEVLTLTYQNGVLTHRDGKPVSYRIFDRLADGEVPDGVGLKALNENTSLRFKKKPLADVVAYLGDFHQVPIAIDPAIVKAFGSKKPTITADFHIIDLASALAMAADDAGVVCDYRNDRIWITLPDATTKKQTNAATPAE